MSKSVYKYALPQPGLTGRIPLAIVPKHIGWQDSLPMLWAEVDLSFSGGAIGTVHCFGTGFHIPDNFEHIGTLQDPGGFVWHWYLER